jgi:hypothetical protein|tara:strand:- start:1286 stop:1435 length:150 start_codon:yes stop_codon:yes gene_type:complete
MNKQDEDFLRHLHKQLAEQKRDEGITTIRALERQRRDNPQKPRPHKNKK